MQRPDSFTDHTFHSADVEGKRSRSQDDVFPVRRSHKPDLSVTESGQREGKVAAKKGILHR